MRFLPFSVLAFCIMSLLAQGPTNVKSILSALADPVTTADAASRLITLGHSRSEVREVADHELPAMLLQTKNVPVVQSEAKVAGTLRLESTIPSLIQLLSWFNFDGNTTMTTSHEMRNDPVARALYEIGAPAEPALKKALERDNEAMRIRVIQILVLRDTLESRAILRQHLATEPDPGLKKSIQLNLSEAPK